MKNLYVFCFLIPIFANSQEWKTLLKAPNANFNDVSASFYEHYEENKNNRSYGEKHFKRLEYFLKPRTFPSGEIKPFKKLAGEFRATPNGTRSYTNADWFPKGITNWGYTGGGNPGNGRINSITVHPSNPQIIYVATAGGGIWKTTDGGTVWYPLTDTLPYLETSDIIINPNNPNEILFADGDNDQPTLGPSTGIYKSSNGGSTWAQTLTFPVPNVKFGYMAFSPTTNDLILAATNIALYISNDGGDTWTVQSNRSLYNLRFHPNNDNIVYGSSGQFLYKSVDQGQSWNILQAFSGATRIEIETHPLEPSYLYALVSASDDSFDGLYLSKNEGATFNSMSNSPNILGHNTDGSSFGGQGEYDLALTINPSNPADITIGGVNIWKSADTGKTWNNINDWYIFNTPANTYTHADIHYLHYYGSKLYCGSDGGIFTSNDNGNSWSNISADINISELYDFSLQKTNNVLAFGAQDNGCFSNYTGWNAISGGDGFATAVSEADPNHIISASQYGSFGESYDNGFSRNIIMGYSTTNEYGDWHTPFHATRNLDTLWAGYERVWFSTNSGGTWNALGSQQIAQYGIDKMEVAEANNTRIYASDYNKIYKIDANYTNYTITSTNITSGLPFAYISSIKTHPNDEDHLWVTLSGNSFGNKIYESLDAGATWTNISGTLPNIPANDVAYSSQNNGLYIAMDAGIYYKDDQNPTWELYNKNLPNVVVMKIIVDEVNDLVYAGSFGRGIWVSNGFYNLSPPVSINENQQLANIHIYPNPSSGIIHIDSFEQLNQIELFSTDGRLIKMFSVIDQDNYTIDLSAYSKGNYFMKFSTKQGHSTTKKIILN